MEVEIYINKHHEFSSYMEIASCGGVDTFVQGTVVQGPLCPRDISPRRLLSKETLVQGDYCPRLKFET